MALLMQYISKSTKKPTKEFYRLSNESDIGYLANVTHVLTFQEKIAKQGKSPMEPPHVNNLTYKLEIEEISGISATENDPKSQQNDKTSSKQ